MLSIRKDCEVEVSLADDEEFKGSYYRAILEDNPMISGHKNLRVRYLTLLKKDSLAPLTEFVDHNFIRPVPPDDLNDGVVFEKGLVVDAYIRAGWWIGVVEKTMEDDKYLVYFNNPPETIQFEKKELRIHLDWINFKWVRYDKKELIKSDFSSGTLVEVRLEFSWLPGIVIEELEDEKKLIVKYKHGKSNITTVDSVRVRPMQPLFPVEKYEVLDRVEAFCGLAWCQGVVRKMIHEGRYMVSFEATDKASQFNHSDLRPSMEWVNEVWHGKGPMPKSRKGSNGKRKKPSKPKKRKKPVALITGNEPMKQPAHEQGNEMIDDVVNEKESGSPITMEITQGNICPEPVSNHNVLGNESTREKMPEEHTQKRKRGELEHSSNINETFLSSDGTSNVVKNVVAIVEETQAKDLVLVLPFAKKSPFWKTYESVEVFKRVPQSPHFNPLCETKEDFREGYAIGMMVTYSSLWERLKDLETDVPVSQLGSLRDSFAELEKNGFDVTLPLSQIEKLLALKDGQLHIVEKLNILKKEMMDETSIKRKAEEELGETEQNISEVKQKILELHKQEVALEKRKESAKEEKDAAYKKICQMESCARDLGVKLEAVEFEFETTLSAPW